MTGLKPVSVELFFAAGCSKCAAARDELRAAVESSGRAQWTEIDVAREPHRAVDAGVVSTPAIAIDGELVFSSLPSVPQLQAAIAAAAQR